MYKTWFKPKLTCAWLCSYLLILIFSLHFLFSLILHVLLFCLSSFFFLSPSLLRSCLSSSFSLLLLLGLPLALATFFSLVFAHFRSLFSSISLSTLLSFFLIPHLSFLSPLLGNHNLLRDILLCFWDITGRSSIKKKYRIRAQNGKRCTMYVAILSWKEGSNIFIFFDIIVSTTELFHSYWWTGIAADILSELNFLFYFECEYTKRHLFFFLKFPANAFQMINREKKKIFCVSLKRNGHTLAAACKTF